MSEFENRVGGVAVRPGRKRFFTLAEANRAIVLIKRIVADVVVGYARMGDLQETLEAASGKADRCSEPMRQELLRTVERLQRCMEELDEVGVELVDWSRGIVDFECLADGRSVCLCWEHGQDRIAFWHEIDSGFAGRQPIETLPIGDKTVLQHNII